MGRKILVDEEVYEAGLSTIAQKMLEKFRLDEDEAEMRQVEQDIRREKKSKKR